MEQISSSGRERILARIRDGVKRPAPRHSLAAVGQPFAPVANTLERFQQECAANLTEYVMTLDRRESAESLTKILSELPAGEIFLQDAAPLREMERQFPAGRAIRWSSEGRPSESAQATVTLADALVAATGSILVSSSCGGRAATVAAPVHIVMASAEQLVPDLTAAFARVRERGTARLNSMLCLITGSSRTADIEKILVMGAHGPKRLIAIVALE